jgi:hypothetical protein
MAGDRPGHCLTIRQKTAAGLSPQPVIETGFAFTADRGDRDFSRFF